jgi:hypothetical protein
MGAWTTARAILIWANHEPGHRHREDTVSRPSISFFSALFALVALVALVDLFLALPARAQMPHDTAASVPLPVGDLPVGTVSVRITRPSMTDAIAGADVIGSWKTPDGKVKTSTVKTGNDGRAVFANLPVGGTFIARAIVEGETLATQAFVVPDQGGTRFLMMVGAEGAQAMGAAPSTPAAGATAGTAEAHGGQPQQLGIRSGRVEPSDNVKAGSVELKVIDADGKPVAGVGVDMAHATGKSVESVHAVTDDHGVAHFAAQKADNTTIYAAVIAHDGMRVGTPAFVLEAKRGAAGEIKMPGRTDSLSVLRIASSSRMMVELREEALGLLQNLVIENTSDKIFDPGPRGLFVPLPEGFTGAEKLPGGSDIEIKEGVGVFLHAPILPGTSAAASVQVRLGYVLATHETREFEIIVPMPIGLQGGLVLVPADHPIGLSAPGLRTRASERDDNGNELLIFELDAVPAGQALHLTVLGLPTHSRNGRWIAAALAGLLVAGGIVASRRPRKRRASDAKAGNSG